MSLGLRQLETFRLFARTRNVTETARLLRISQPAVSQTLKELEAQLGFSIFARTRGKTRLTTEALLLLPEVERLFVQLSSLRGRAEELRDARSGMLVIASVPTLAGTIIPQAMANLKVEREKVQFQLSIETASEVARQVRGEYADIGLAFTPVDETGIVVEPLIQVPVVCFVPRHHPLAARNVLTPKDLQHETIITHGMETPTGRAVREKLGRNFESMTVLQINLTTAALNLAQHGFGIALGHPLVLTAQAMEDVVSVAFKPEIDVTLSFIYSRNKPMPRIVARFIHHMRSSLKDAAAKLQTHGVKSKLFFKD
jgi:DNA-binding transcriptional LysR family regulator